jgi:hypothetical protein
MRIAFLGLILGYIVHRADDGAFDSLSDCASAALSGKCLSMKSAAHPGLEP